MYIMVVLVGRVMEAKRKIEFIGEYTDTTHIVWKQIMMDCVRRSMCNDEVQVWLT